MALRLVAYLRPAPRPARRQRARHAPSLRFPGYTACGLPPSSRPADNLELEPPWTCRRCLAICGEGDA